MPIVQPSAPGITSIATTSPISGGTITSSGTISLLVNVDFAWTVAQSLTVGLAANTSGDGLSLVNSTAATSGNQRYSPRLRLTGQGWKTNATAASQTVDWIVENQPVQGAANPTSNLAWSSQINAGGYSPAVTFFSTGLGCGTTYATATTDTVGAGSTLAIALPNKGEVVARNGGNNANRLLIGLDSTDRVWVGNSSSTLLLSSGFWSISSSSAALSSLNRAYPLAIGGESYLYSDAANTFAQYNSTNAQAYRLYNTRTDASNNEHFNLAWSSNVLHLGAVKNGTGTARVVQIDYGGTTTAAISVPITSGAITFGGSLTTTGVASTIASGTAIPAGGTAGTGYAFSSTANFGMFFGSGAPTLAAAKGSLYLRSDGSTTNDRAYINSDGNTTWTALTTAA